MRRDGRSSRGRGYLGDRRRTGTRMVGADGMARAPPIAPMRRPRHHGADREGGGHACTGAGHRRTVDRGGSARACCNGAALHAVWSGRTGWRRHIDRLGGGEVNEAALFYSSVTHLRPPSSPCLWGHGHGGPALQRDAKRIQAGAPRNSSRPSTNPAPGICYLSHSC